MPKVWFLKQNGKVFGPMPAEKLKAAAVAGKISGKDEVANEKTGPWQPVSKMKGLAELAKPDSSTKSTTARLKLPPGTPMFSEISGTFKIDKTKYFGSVVASQRFLYVIIRQKRNDLANAIGGGLGGAVGGLIAGAISAAGSRKSLTIETRKLDELHPKVLGHPDWPIKPTKKDSKYDVAIVPRELVALVDHPRFTNFLNFKVGETSITVEYFVMQGKLARDYLVKTGWPVRWCGKDLKNK